MAEAPKYISGKKNSYVLKFIVGGIGAPALLLVYIRSFSQCFLQFRTDYHLLFPMHIQIRVTLFLWPYSSFPVVI
jgi:hypothetical protein